MTDIDDFLETAAKLKSVKRQGWVERGVREPESSADHSWMMALMCMTLPFDGDRNKAVKMAIVHDLAEAVVGDIITKENWEAGGTMRAKDKQKLEKNAFAEMVSSLEKQASKEMLSLWEEFEGGKTSEAMFVKDVDAAERLIQAFRYHKAGNFCKPLDGFWDDKAMSTIRSEAIKTLIRRIIES